MRNLDRIGPYLTQRLPAMIRERDLATFADIGVLESEIRDLEYEVTGLTSREKKTADALSTLELRLERIARSRR
jgi:hypothetical protein